MRKSTLALCALFATNSWASDVSKDDLVVCAAKSNAVQRLECFDAIAMKAGATATTANTTNPNAGKWITKTTSDPLTDKNIYFAQIIADSGRGRFAPEIAMIVRCKDNKTEMFINWGSFLGTDGIDVTHRVGKSDSERKEWSVSTDHKASFFPGSPIATLKEIIESDTFVANVTPYSESPITAVFDTKGAGVALADIRSGCGW